MPASGNQNEFEIIVKGLSYEAAEDDIQTYFGECGEITRINLLKNPDGSSKGLAFIRFSDEASMNSALQCDGNTFMDFNLKIEKTKPREQRDQAPRQ